MYATVDDMVAQLGIDEVLSLSDREQGGVLSAKARAIVEDALARATSDMDSYLATRHVVPLTVIPAVVKTRCVDIAYYLLCRGNRILTDDIKALYSDALRWLRDVSQGKASLGLPPEPADAVQGDAVLFSAGKASIFSDATSGAGGEDE